jgi:hypothetical protein
MLIKDFLWDVPRTVFGWTGPDVGLTKLATWFTILTKPIQTAVSKAIEIVKVTLNVPGGDGGSRGILKMFIILIKLVSTLYKNGTLWSFYKIIWSNFGP